MAAASRRPNRKSRRTPERSATVFLRLRRELWGATGASFWAAEPSVLAVAPASVKRRGWQQSSLQSGKADAAWTPVANFEGAENEKLAPWGRSCPFVGGSAQRLDAPIGGIQKNTAEDVTRRIGVGAALFYRSATWLQHTPQVRQMDFHCRQQAGAAILSKRYSAA